MGENFVKNMGEKNVWVKKDMGENFVNNMGEKNTWVKTLQKNMGETS